MEPRRGHQARTSGSHGALPSGLDDDAPAIVDFHAQAVAVEQPHTYEGIYANRPGFDVSHLAVPEHRSAVHVEGGLAAVSQDRLSITHDGQSQVSRQHRRQGQVAIEAGINHGLDFPRLTRRASQRKDYDRFEVGVHEALHHPAHELRRHAGDAAVHRPAAHHRGLQFRGNTCTSDGKMLSTRLELTVAGPRYDFLPASMR